MQMKTFTLDDRHGPRDKSKNSNVERTVYVSPDVGPGDSLRYGDWVESRGGYFPFPSYVPLTIIEAATGSDYSGSLVERSNFEVLQRDYPWLVEIHGGHGTFGLGYLGKRENQNEALLEAIDALSDYPILDDDHHSSLEWNTAAEAWDSYGRDDFKRALVKYFDAVYAPDEHKLDEISDERIDQLWHDCTERLCGGEAHLNEQGESIYFPIDSIIKKITQCWTGLDKPAYDGTRPSINVQLVSIASDATIQTEVTS